DHADDVGADASGPGGDATMAPRNTAGLASEAMLTRRAFVVPRTPGPILTLALAVSPPAAVTAVIAAPNGSVPLPTPNPPLRASTVTAAPNFGVIEQAINDGPLVAKKVGDRISLAANSVVMYRNTNAAAAADTFSIGGFVFEVTIQYGGRRASR